MTELLPCPMDAGALRVYEHEGPYHNTYNNPNVWSVMCDNNDCRFCLESFRTEQDATAAANTRAASLSEWQVPEGWNLVPIEPTTKMLSAVNVWVGNPDKTRKDATIEQWKKMLAAAHPVESSPTWKLINNYEKLKRALITMMGFWDTPGEFDPLEATPEYFIAMINAREAIAAPPNNHNQGETK